MYIPGSLSNIIFINPRLMYCNDFNIDLSSFVTFLYVEIPAESSSC